MSLFVIQSWVRGLVDCLRAWWQVDRIRVSPREGRLLRLRPPCVVVIESDAVELVQRMVAHDAEGPSVVYFAERCGRLGRLIVRSGKASEQTRIQWVESERTADLSESDVLVLGEVASASRSPAS